MILYRYHLLGKLIYEPALVRLSKWYKRHLSDSGLGGGARNTWTIHCLVVEARPRYRPKGRLGSVTDLYEDSVSYNSHLSLIISRRYQTASDALEAYIDRFEGKTHRRYYTRRVSDLLSPKPKFRFMDAVDRSLQRKLVNVGSTTSRELLNWVNSSYRDDLERTCEPAYQGQKGDLKSSKIPDYQPLAFGIMLTYFLLKYPNVDEMCNHFVKASILPFLPVRKGVLFPLENLFYSVEQSQTNRCAEILYNTSH